MTARRTIGCLITLAALAGLLPSAPAGTTDVAAYMPRETALYFGWSPWLAEQSAEFQAGRRFVDAALNLVAEEDEPLPPAVKRLTEALVRLSTCSGGIGLIDVNLVEGQPDVQAALLVAAGPASADTAQALRDLLAEVDATLTIEERTIGGATFACVSLPDTPFKLVWGAHKDCFLLTLGEAAAGKVVACLNGSGESLATAPELQFDRQKVQASLEGKFICVYADVQRMVTRGKEIATELLGTLPPEVEPLIAELGIGATRSKYFHLQDTGGQRRMTIFAHVDGPLRGLLKLYDQEPLTEADLKIVPQDAYWASVGNLDLRGLWEEGLRILEEVAPEHVATVQGALAMTIPILGFSLTDDLLPALGNTWALFDAPDHGGLLLTGTVLVADIADQQKFEGLLMRIVQIVTPFAEQEDVHLTVKKTQHGGHTIHYVLVGGVPSPVAPAWGFVDGRWVFGLFPQTVAAALRQADPKTRGESILDHPDVKAALPKLPPKMQGFGYWDARYATRLLFPLTNAARTLAASLLGPRGAEIDLALLPPVAEEAAKIQRYVSSSGRDQDGVLCASVGDGLPLPAVAGLAGLSASMLLPAAAHAREDAKAAVSMSNLRGIGQACIVYSVDQNEQFPPSFDVLLSEQLITPKQLQSPFDPEGTVSYVLVKWARRLSAAGNPARLVLAYERQPRDGMMNTLFADGHVERVPVDDFQQLLADTQAAVGSAEGETH